MNPEDQQQPQEAIGPGAADQGLLSGTNFFPDWTEYLPLIKGGIKVLSVLVSAPSSPLGRLLFLPGDLSLATRPSHKKPGRVEQHSCYPATPFQTEVLPRCLIPGHDL